MAVFKAFKPEAINKIAKAMGYTGDMGQFQSFIEQDPMRQQQMQRYTNAAMQMAKGGVVKMQTGGLTQGMAGPGYSSLTPTQGMGPLMGPAQDGMYRGPGSVGPGSFGPQVVVYGPDGQTYGNPQLAAQAGVTNPTMAPPPGVTPIPMQVDPQKAKAAADAERAMMMGRIPPSQPNPISPTTTTPPAATPPAAQTEQTGITEATMQRMFTPGLPQGGQVTAAATPLAAGQMIDPRVGAVAGGVAVPTAMAGVQQAAPTQEQQAAQMQAAQAAPAVNTALQANEAAQGTVDPRAQVTAAQQTASSVGDVTAAQGNAVLIDNPVQRNIQAGELITGAAADAATAAQFTEQVQAAEATPSTQATVQGQLAQLTANFDAANPPAWAAGAMRSATAQMAARGLGASSLAGQAIVQATIEAALPIAQADAATTAQFEAQNLSNRQQRAMLAAQQRAQFMGQEFDQAFQARVQNAAKVSDVANQNFTAEQQVQLENSRIANTANLTNLSNKQALVMAEAASLAQLDTQNLNNRQQSAVQNAQNFLQVDMTNLSNRQQTDLFNAQQRVQSLFTDQAAENASRQFNASSQNQVDQFFANLASQTSQFNASQVNAQSQFNAGQRNTLERFNAELNNQRDQFNAQNQLVIAQSNAQWRREIATADTAAVNRANELNANAILDIGNQAYANLWNYYADTMEWAWTSAENQVDRNNALAIAELDAAARKAIAGEQASSAAGTAIGSLIGTLGSAWIMCWVAREVYGKQNVQWFIFRAWLQYDAPKWFRELYKKHGENYAKVIAKVPPLKWATKALMDLVVERKKRKHHVSCAY